MSSATHHRIENHGYTGPIIDAHFHVWDIDHNLYPWLLPEARVPHRYGNYDAIKKNYLTQNYRDDIKGNNIVCGIYMEAEWDPTDPIGETRYIASLADEDSIFGAMVAQAWLNAPNVDEVLATQSSFPLVKSIRHKPGGPMSPQAVKSGEYSLMSDPLWRKGYGLLSQHGLHFELQTPWWNLYEARTLAQDYPETLIVINHSGVILDRDPQTLKDWQQALIAIALYPNVVIKASGLGMAGKPFSIDNNELVINTMIDIFGCDRVMFGSNFPVDGLFGRYDHLVMVYREITRNLSKSDQYQFFFGTASTVYQPNIVHSKV